MTSQMTSPMAPEEMLSSLAEIEIELAGYETAIVRLKVARYQLHVDLRRAGWRRRGGWGPPELESAHG